MKGLIDLFLIFILLWVLISVFKLSPEVSGIIAGIVFFLRVGTVFLEELKNIRKDN